MKYPKPYKKGELIGICTPSSGVTGPFENKLAYGIQQMAALGYPSKETSLVRKQHKAASGPAEIRALEFMELYTDPAVKAIIPPWGGELLIDILPYLDFEVLNTLPPKWIMGFSDTSTLLFVMTLKLNMATAHGPNFMDFSNTAVHESVFRALDILGTEPGESFEQHSLTHYQKEWLAVTETEFPPYNLTEKVEWKALGGSKEANFGGRLIGGCLDVLCKLIGTPYAPVEAYLEQFEEEGIIWYLESCEMKASDIYRTLWQMKQCGWFKNCRGVLYGRVEGYEDTQDLTYVDALQAAFGALSIPVLYDADIGHMPPQLTFINGAQAKVYYTEGKAKILQFFV
ncbi:Muramoyltetrapeptide carboxypeptidase LdcA (peptidoglycan recycling) [Geosporobacter subterraneus DSM 17957]|uniref:Muramoyltetrapeptide carboxypeptidase LdcA (Peptidoglycan recycling) n=1 Tax=Geosporobacter subterraneus DSM 17957 TaxID=1121919 RepID=A0A1M6GLG5_9FIRM|nr:S66 peptidase family protein [Geosporobacter subterraneus]SHJ10735.1 Muramoyltetrapeptide carboxypeptidase LdcA (peptidoglycan recycling) [Geosporobacter subterraneus DSM 17957]